MHKHILTVILWCNIIYMYVKYFNQIFASKEMTSVITVIFLLYPHCFTIYAFKSTKNNY